MQRPLLFAVLQGRQHQLAQEFSQQPGPLESGWSRHVLTWTFAPSLPIII